MNLMADERFAAPVLGDVGEQSVLDAVPFAGAGRQMDDRHGEAGLVGEALQLAFPQMNARAVTTAAIGRDQKTSRTGIASLAEPLPPAPFSSCRPRSPVGQRRVRPSPWH